jgi:hypothetical protein
MELTPTEEGDEGIPGVDLGWTHLGTVWDVINQVYRARESTVKI